MAEVISGLESYATNGLVVCDIPRQTLKLFFLTELKNRHLSLNFITPVHSEFF